MFEIRQTAEYRRWFAGLRDTEARHRIGARLRRLSLGSLGDSRSVGEGVLELRIDYGPGSLIVLLAGGDKSSQRQDIERAKGIARGV